MMKEEYIRIQNIPAIIWGEKSDKVYLYVHGKMSSKKSAKKVAFVAQEKGYQTVSFDLPQHGERMQESERCDIWHGVHDLKIMADYVFENWREVSLFACSLGAYFSLHAYSEYDIKKCLFQSPIVDMAYLIKQMMIWFGISEERLFKEKEVNTPIDVMTWDYYQFVREHPIQKWHIPTSILYGGKDNLQSLDVMQRFCEQFSVKLTISSESEHPLMEEKDREIVKRWLEENL